MKKLPLLKTLLVGVLAFSVFALGGCGTTETKGGDGMSTL